MRITEVVGITEAEFEKLAEKKDACYHKVKSRYKVWPSAYASGALVQCRKKGRASAAQRKRREDPNPERRGKAKNVATKKK